MIDYEQLVEQYSQAASVAEQERAQADALFLSIGDGVITTDADARINRVNQTALHILGCQEKDLLGKWFPVAVTAVDENGGPLATIDRPITRAFLTGKPIHATSFYKTRHNDKLPVSVTVSPVLFDGKPIGAIEVFRDIAHEYEVDRMKSEFISIASHQLRTPLTAISTYARMINDGYVGEVKPQQKEFLETIVTSVDRMNELITALLDISRIESGSLQLSLKKVDFSQLIRKLATDMRGDAEKRGIRLRLQLPDEPVVIRSDPVLLPEVCANLISNAIKYTPDGGKVTIKLKADKSSIVLSVADTGYGIPEETKHRVFTKFYRGENIITRVTSGTGLGLYLVKLIADTMGGRTWFKSTEGKGSTFYFSLPNRPKELSN